MKEYGVASSSFVNFTDTALNAALDDLISLGMKWLRVDMVWSGVEPTQGTYDWSKYDRLVTFANNKNVKLLFIIDYGNPWASGNPDKKYPPTDPNTYATFAAMVVARYSPLGVKTYEIWNEPNVSAFWKPVPSAAAYTALLKVAYTAMKGVDSTITILTAGLSPAINDSTHIEPNTFLTGIYAAGGQGYFDAVAFHPYTYPGMPVSTTTNWHVMSIMYNTMVANGDSAKKMWITEYGAPTDGAVGDGHVTESVQATMLSQAVTEKNNLTFTGPMFFYTYKDFAPAPNRENYFGLIRYDGTQKPSYSSVKNAIATT